MALLFCSVIPRCCHPSAKAELERPRDQDSQVGIAHLESAPSRLTQQATDRELLYDNFYGKGLFYLQVLNGVDAFAFITPQLQATDKELLILKTII